MPNINVKNLDNMLARIKEENQSPEKNIDWL